MKFLISFLCIFMLVILFTTNIFAQQFEPMIFDQAISLNQETTQPKQNEDTKKYDMTGLVFSISFFDYYSIGIGFNKGIYSIIGSHYAAFAYGVLAEYRIARDLNIRPYVRLYGSSGGMLLGISIMYATDFTTSTAGFSPEIGFGLGKINLFYRYNFYIDASYNGHEIVFVVYDFKS